LVFSQNALSIGLKGRKACSNLLTI